MKLKISRTSCRLYV